MITKFRRVGLAVALSTAALAATTLTVTVSPAQAAGSDLQAAGKKAVQIVSVQYDSPGSDRGSNESLNAEWVLIKNTGKKKRKITGFELSDVAGHTFTFGKKTLGPGESVKVHTGTGDDTKAHKYWDSGWYIWNNDGDTATLKTAKGTTVDTCKWDGGEQKKNC